MKRVLNLLIFLTSGSMLHAMHIDRIDRLNSDECDIENQRLIPIAIEDAPDTARVRSAKTRCIRKSATYCQLLANLKQLPPRLQSSIADSINEEIKEWKHAIETCDYNKTQNLFEKLSTTLIQECEATPCEIFQSEEATCCGFNTGIIERSFTREFGLQLRTTLELNDLEKTKALAHIFRKWRLYFTHLTEAAHIKFHAGYLKESAFAASPIPLPIASALLAIYNHTTLSYIGLGLTALGVAATQIAIRKFGVLSAFKPLRIHEEIAKVQLSLAHFEHAISVHKTKLNAVTKIKNALQEKNIRKPFSAEFNEKLQKFDDIINDIASDYPTDLTPLKAQRKLIIDYIHKNKDKVSA